MAEDKQPSSLTAGATPAGDIEEEIPAQKSAEDRKAASALASLDAGGPSSSPSSSASAAAAAAAVDSEAVSKAMKNLGASSAAAAEKSKQSKAPAGKSVKVDQADVALLVDELEVSKVRATEMLRSCEGDAVKAMREFVTAA